MKIILFLLSISCLGKLQSAENDLVKGTTRLGNLEQESIQARQRRRRKKRLEGNVDGNNDEIHSRKRPRQKSLKTVKESTKEPRLTVVKVTSTVKSKGIESTRRLTAPVETKVQKSTETVGIETMSATRLKESTETVGVETSSTTELKESTATQTVTQEVAPISTEIKDSDDDVESNDQDSNQNNSKSKPEDGEQVPDDEPSEDIPSEDSESIENQVPQDGELNENSKSENEPKRPRFEINDDFQDTNFILDTSQKNQVDQDEEAKVLEEEIENEPNEETIELEGGPVVVAENHKEDTILPSPTQNEGESKPNVATIAKTVRGSNILVPGIIGGLVVVCIAGLGLYITKFKKANHPIEMENGSHFTIQDDDDDDSSNKDEKFNSLLNFRDSCIVENIEPKSRCLLKSFHPQDYPQTDSILIDMNRTILSTEFKPFTLESDDEDQESQRSQSFLSQVSQKSNSFISEYYAHQNNLESSDSESEFVNDESIVSNHSASNPKDSYFFSEFRDDSL